MAATDVDGSVTSDPSSLTMVGNQINLLFKNEERSPAGAAMTLLLMITTLALTWIYHRLRKTEGLV